MVYSLMATPLWCQWRSHQKFHVRDGLGIKCWWTRVFKWQCLVATPYFHVVALPILVLNILSGKWKETACFDLMKQAGVTEQTAYIGDDSVISRLCCLKLLLQWLMLYLCEECCWSCTFHPWRKRCLREMSDMILQAQGNPLIWYRPRFPKISENMGAMVTNSSVYCLVKRSNHKHCSIYRPLIAPLTTHLYLL